MPVYCWKCSVCSHTQENMIRQYMLCPECGAVMVRDFRAENATNTFHPTVDVYAKSQSQRRKGR